MLRIILAITVSYLIGSVPTAYIFGKILKRIDIRKFGSGNVGATNAMRILGKGPGIVVLLLDAVKGFIPVVFLADGELTRVILGLCCILGHNWTVFLRFKGGKGMATTLGVLIGLAAKIPGLKIVLAAVIIVWAVVFAVTRIVSLASISSALVLPLLMLLFKQSAIMIFSSIILSALAIFRHKSNLTRLFQGKEKRIFS